MRGSTKSLQYFIVTGLYNVIFNVILYYTGLSCEGIYRISGVKSKIQLLRDCYNRGAPVYLEEHEPNIIASLLKQFLRELPEPVLTKGLMGKFEEASGQCHLSVKVISESGSSQCHLSVRIIIVPSYCVWHVSVIVILILS